MNQHRIRLWARKILNGKLRLKYMEVSLEFRAHGLEICELNR